MPIINQIHSLDIIFNPKTIAVIGASDEVGSVGYTIFQNLLKFDGQIVPVNPKHLTVGGVKSYASILEIQLEVDLAIVVVPAKFSIGVMVEISKTNCKSVVFISAGFKEVGGEGAILDAQLVDICQKNQIQLIGPNCLGVMNVVNGLNASFAGSVPPKGNIALISQSGAICTAIIDSAEHLGLGFSKFISTGNKSVLSEPDLINYLDKDQDTKIIAIYLEDLHNSKNFIEACQKSTKPIIVLKSGKSEAGAQSACSHTGALASSPALYKALFRQAGCIEVDSIEEFFEVMLAISLNPIVDVNNIAIITNAGGPGVLSTDAAIFNNIKLATFDQATTNQLKLALPPAANTHNPIDLIGDATSQRYAKSLELVMSDSGVDGIVVILTPQAMTDVANIGQLIIDAKKKYSKPIVVSMIGFRQVHTTVDYLRLNHVAVIDFPENAVRAISKIKIQNSSDKIINKGFDTIKIPQETKIQIHKLFEDSKSKGQKFISEFGSSLVTRSYNIPLVSSKLVHTQDEAVFAVQDLITSKDDELVFKIVSQDIFHKTDVGGVIVGVKQEEAAKAHETIIKNVKSKAPKAIIDGVLITKLVDYTTQNQFILGAKKDSVLGHSIMIGLGGIFVEVFKDAAFGFVPLGEAEIDKMLTELKSQKFLLGTRGQNPLDVHALKQVILNLSKLLQDFPKISEIDFNPIIVKEDGVVILDCKIVLE